MLTQPGYIGSYAVEVDLVLKTLIKFTPKTLIFFDRKLGFVPKMLDFNNEWIS